MSGAVARGQLTITSVFDGYNVIVADTDVRNYDYGTWAMYGNKGYQTKWLNIKNAADMKVGDIMMITGIISNQKNANVSLYALVNEIDGTTVTATSQVLLTGEQGEKGDAGRDYIENLMYDTAFTVLNDFGEVRNWTTVNNYPQNSSVVIDAVEKINNCNALHITTSGATTAVYSRLTYYSGINWSSQMVFVPNQEYTFSFYLKSPDPSKIDTRFASEVYLLKGTARVASPNKNFYVEVKDITTEWKLFINHFTFTAEQIPEGVNGFEISLILQKNGEVFVACPKLEAGHNDAPVWTPNQQDFKADEPSNAENLLLNSSFEKLKANGFPELWSLLGKVNEFASMDNTVKYDGYSTFKIDVSGLTANAYTGIWQPSHTAKVFTPTAGEKYTLSVMVMTDDMSTIDTGAILETYYYKDNGSGGVTYMSQATQYIRFPANNKWLRCYKKITIPDGCVSMAYRVLIYKNGRMWVSQPKLERGWTDNPQWTRNNRELVGENAIVYRLEPQNSSIKLSLDGNTVTPSTLKVKKYKIDGNSAAVETTDTNIVIKYKLEYESGSTTAEATYTSSGITLSGKGLLNKSRLRRVILNLYNGSTLIETTSVPAVTDAYELKQTFEAADGKLQSSISELTTRTSTLERETKWNETVIDLCGDNEDVWYPVLFALREKEECRCRVIKDLALASGEHKPKWATHPTDSFVLLLQWKVTGASWGAANENRYIENYDLRFVETFAASAKRGLELPIPEGLTSNSFVPACSMPIQFTNISMECVYLRGGARYRCGISNATSSSAVMQKTKIYVARYNGASIKINASNTYWNKKTWAFKDSAQSKLFNRNDVYYRFNDDDELIPSGKFINSSTVPGDPVADFPDYDKLVAKGLPGFEGYIDIDTTNSGWVNNPAHLPLANRITIPPIPPEITFDALKKNVTVVTQKVSTLTQNMDSISTRVGKAESTLKNYESLPDLIQQNADNVSALITKTDKTNKDLNEVKGDISSQGGAIADLENAMTTKVEESQLTQLSNKIATKVSQAEYDENNNIVSGKISELTQTADNINLQVQTSKGFINLLKYSDTFSDEKGNAVMKPYNSGTAILSSKGPGGGAGISFAARTSAQAASIRTVNSIFLKKGKYTISFTTDNTGVYPHAVFIGASVGWLATVSLVSKWKNGGKQRVYQTYTIETAENYTVDFTNYYYYACNVYDILIEEGEYPHEYSTDNDVVRRSGIDISPDEVTITSSKVKVKLSDSTDTAMFVTKNGKTVLNTSIVETDMVICYDALGRKSTSFNESGDGAHRIYYSPRVQLGGGYAEPQVMCNFGYDAATNSVIQFYDENGNVLWTIGKDFDTPQSKRLEEITRWETVTSLANVTEDNAKISTDLAPTTYYRFHSTDETISAETGNPFKDYNNCLFTSESLKAPFTGTLYDLRATLKMSEAGNVENSTYQRRAYKYVSGKLISTTTITFTIQ